MSIQTIPDAKEQWATRNLKATEHIDDGITLDWLSDGKIVCFTINTVTRTAVDAWLNRSKEIAQMWPAEAPYLAIQDVSGATLTPYMRQRSSETVAQTPRYLRGRSAVVMPATAVNRLIQIFVTVSLARQQTSIQRAVFLKRQDAINWLLQHK